MLLMPFGILFFWISGLLSLALLGGGIYLVWYWYYWGPALANDEIYLWAGLAMVAFSIFGGPLVVRPLLRLGRGPDEPEAARNGATQRISRPDGTELHVEIYGPANAPALVLTHGWGLDGTEWYYAKRHFAERFRLIIWDLPGLGKSSRPKNNDYALEKMARDLEAVIGVAGEGPVVLLGHSIGGMITLTFCRLFPEQLGSRVAGLILTHTTYTNPVKTSKFSGFLRAVQKPLLEPLLYLMIGLSPLMRLMSWLNYLNGMTHLHVHRDHYSGHETRGQMEFIARFSLQAPPSVVARGMLAMMRWDAGETLPTIPVPTLVVAANADKATLPIASQHMAETIPNAQIVDLVPAGHTGLIEQHGRWVEVVNTFAAACLGAQRTR